MAVSPISFSLPVSQLRETLDRSGQGHGAALPTPGAGPASGVAQRFANALHEALQTGGPEALDQLSQASLGSGFLSMMQGAGASKAAGLAEANLLLDTLQGAANGQTPDLAGLLGAAIPGGLKGADLSRVAQALNTAFAAPANPGPQAAAAPQRIHGPSRIQGPTRLDAAAPVQAPQAGTAAAEVPRPDQIVSAARTGDAAATSPTLHLAKAALARRAYGKAEAQAARGSGVDILGALSARFESGGDAAAVGYDRVGGTSYGTYQISSRAGTFDSFMTFLHKNAPDIASRLQAAGPANTGSTAGPMPSAWKTIAHEQPRRFEQLQHDFIRETHFNPALQKIADATGVDLSGRNQALAQVLWSTAVQHGATGSARIFSSALEALGSMAPGPDSERSLIREVYARRSGNFTSSTPHVQQAVKGRFTQEMRAALSLLDGTSLLDTGA